MLSVDLSERPVDASSFKAYEQKDLPKVILGFQVKHLLDQERLRFKSAYNAKYILHYTSSSNGLEPVFFYGVEVPVEHNRQSMDEFFQFTSQLLLKCISPEEYIETYQRGLKKIGLSCDTCFRYLQDGIYPIDSRHISLFDNCNRFPKDLSTMLEIPNEQWYLHISSPCIYVLTTCASYILGM